MIFRSSCRCKKGFLNNFANFTGKHLCVGSPFIKDSSVRSATSLKRLQHRRFLVKFAKLLKTLKNIYFVEHLQTAASGYCKHSIWICYEIKDVDSTKLTSFFLNWSVSNCSSYFSAYFSAYKLTGWKPLNICLFKVNSRTLQNVVKYV